LRRIVRSGMGKLRWQCAIPRWGHVLYSAFVLRRLASPIPAPPRALKLFDMPTA
jgi:hypothetical protein